MAEWKGAAPLLVLLFAVAVFAWAGVPLTRFWGYITMAAAWFLITPILSASGIGRVANKWFISAGAFSLFSASFTLLTELEGKLAAFPQEWVKVLMGIGLILSWITALVGSLVVVYSSLSE